MWSVSAPSDLIPQKRQMTIFIVCVCVCVWGGGGGGGWSSRITTNVQQADDSMQRIQGRWLSIV